ncbi:MAG: type secretion system protein [Actinomycetia bacterium]|jgi:tight adherence protein B|nr:type secretion system protein [Actinomycetes bacterium]MDQ1651689.1 tight adherence protein [Cryptosporangiaceae bacterium]
MNLELSGILVAVFAGAFLLILAVLLPALTQGGKKKRLRQLNWFDGSGAATQPEGAAAQAVAHAQSMLSWADRTIDDRADTDRLAISLERAGITLRPQEWLLIWAGSTFAGVAGGLILLPWWVGMPLGAAAGFGAPWLYRQLMARRRVNRFAEQLPDALQLIVGSLQAGFSLPQALDTLVRESAAPVSAEFGRVLAETRLGAELEDALERCAERTDSQDLSYMVMAIRIHRDVGGSLAEVLTTTVTTMRERFRLKRQVRALSAEGRLSAYVLVGLPIAIGAYMFLFRSDYVRPLYTTFAGTLMLAAGVVMITAGAFWMSRLIKVEV